MGDSLGFLPFSFPFDSSNGHTLARAKTDEVTFELGKRGENVEEHLAHRVGRIVDGRSKLELHAPLHQLVGNSPGIRHRAGEAVELEDDESVAGADCGECLIKAWPLSIGARQAVIGVDAVSCDTELQQRVALDSQVLLVS